MLDKHIDHPAIVPWSLAAVAMSVAAIAVGAYLDSLGTWRSFFRENGPVEYFEVFFLLIGCALFAYRFHRSNGSVAAWCAPIVYLVVHAILREVPRCDSDFYVDGACITREFRSVSIAVATVILAAVLYLRRADLAGMIRFRVMLVFWPLGVSFLMLEAAEVPEKLKWEGIEESLEFAAYFYTIALGVWMLRNSRPGTEKAQ